MSAESEPGQRITNRSYDERRFSPLDIINEDNVGELGLAWYADLPTNPNLENRRSISTG